MKIKFLQDRTTKCRKEDQESFRKGQVVDLPEASARHWLNRGVAVEVGARPRIEEPDEPEEKKPEDKKPEPKK